MNYQALTLIAMLIIGLHYFFLKLLLPHLPAEVVTPLTFVAGAIFLFGYVFYARMPIPANRFTLYACLLGVFIAISILLLYKAIQLGPISTILPLYCLYMVIPVTLGIAILREPVSIPKVVGIGFACIAVVLLTR